jgi:raffinose/stachyose/melibiose transport system permease protein
MILKNNKINVNKMVFNCAILIFGVIIAFAFLAPVIVIFINSFKSANEMSKGNILSWPENFTLENYITVEEVTKMTSKIGNSILISISVSFLTVFLAFINAYVISIGKISIKNKYIGSLLLNVFFVLHADSPCVYYIPHLLWFTIY